MFTEGSIFLKTAQDVIHLLEQQVETSSCSSVTTNNLYTWHCKTKHSQVVVYNIKISQAHFTIGLLGKQGVYILQVQNSCTGQVYKRHTLYE